MEVKQSFLNKARQDKFLLVFDVPPILKGIVSKTVRNNSTVIPDSIQFSIFGTVIPEIIVKGSESRYSGSTLYTSTHSKDAYPSVSVKFNVDSMYNNYYVIYTWLNVLHDQKTGVFNQKNLKPEDWNFNDYMTDLTVYGLDEFGKKRISFKYVKAFPTSIQEITYNQKAEQGEELECGFSFLFSQLHVELLEQR